MSQEIERHDIESLLDEFRKLDAEMKIIISDWQGSYVDGVWTPNLHDNPEKDFSILERLFQLYDSLSTLFDKKKDVLNEHSELKTMVCTYMNKLKMSVEKIRNGEFNFIDDPNIESFHTVWMSLHQSLESYAKDIENG
jgi:hypothetical protein